MVRQKALCPPARGTLVIAMCNQARMATVLPRTPTRCTRAYAAVSVIRFPRRTPPPSPSSFLLPPPPPLRSRRVDRFRNGRRSRGRSFRASAGPNFPPPPFLRPSLADGRADENGEGTERPVFPLSFPWSPLLPRPSRCPLRLSTSIIGKRDIYRVT